MLAIISCPSRFLITLIAFVFVSCNTEKPIDREALVGRHTVTNTSFDTLGSLTVGNGGFAYTVDFTGLQTFPEEYSRGIPLGTLSDWGWHSFSNEFDYQIEETMAEYRVHDRDIPYSVQVKNKKQKPSPIILDLGQFNQVVILNK